MDLHAKLADARHDIKSPLAGLKALVYLARSHLKKNNLAQVEKDLDRLDARIGEIVAQVDVSLREISP